MPSRIHFIGGTRLDVHDDPKRLVSYLKSGWGSAPVGEDRYVDVNGANVLYVEEIQPEDFVFHVYG